MGTPHVCSFLLNNRALRFRNGARLEVPFNSNYWVFSNLIHRHISKVTSTVYRATLVEIFERGLVC